MRDGNGVKVGISSFECADLSFENGVANVRKQSFVPYFATSCFDTGISGIRSAYFIKATEGQYQIDDQFAIAYAMLSEQIAVEAIYAVPFYNSLASDPGDGMEKSYQEIHRVLGKLDHQHENFVFRGSRTYLPGADRPVESEAAADLIQRAMAERDKPLYVAAIGAITNVASAILMEPRIIERIVLVWIGGQPHYWHNAIEFNLAQDIPSAQVIFDCGVPLVQVPCKNVSEHLRTTVPEMECYVKGRGAMGSYRLASQFLMGAIIYQPQPDTDQRGHVEF